MERKTFESAAANYPHVHLQGLYAVPFGFIWVLTGLSNLQSKSVAPVILGCGVLLCLGALGLIGRYYANSFGRVTPTRSRQVRYFVALPLSFAVFVGVDQLARSVLGRPPGQPVSTYAISWAVGMLVFYASTVGLRAHHLVIWGSLLVAGLLPIWGLGADRDAVAMFPIGAATVLSGVLDHRLFVRSLASWHGRDLETSSVGG
jgi:hypothetical protein